MTGRSRSYSFLESAVIWPVAVTADLGKWPNLTWPVNTTKGTSLRVIYSKTMSFKLFVSSDLTPDISFESNSGWETGLNLRVTVRHTKLATIMNSSSEASMRCSVRCGTICKRFWNAWCSFLVLYLSDTWAKVEATKYRNKLKSEGLFLHLPVQLSHRDQAVCDQHLNTAHSMHSSAEVSFMMDQRISCAAESQ